jgi:hypothetical protein
MLVVGFTENVRAVQSSYYSSCPCLVRLVQADLANTLSCMTGRGLPMAPSLLRALQNRRMCEIGCYKSADAAVCRRPHRAALSFPPKRRLKGWLSAMQSAARGR